MYPKDDRKPDTRDRRFPETIGSLEGITEPDTSASCVDVFSTGPFDSDGSEFAQKTSSQSQPSGDAARDREVQPELTGSIQGSQARAEETRRRGDTESPILASSRRVTSFEASDIAIEYLIGEAGGKSLEKICTCRRDLELGREEVAEEEAVVRMLVDADYD
ncbi:hypothetical protein F5887DRAFT_1077165 [Amanita rubescens]|nr:hypothetical protein F5887DRAFT_1077165 [Amanita rubescens]